MANDMKSYLRGLEREGYTTRWTGTNHVQIRDPRGRIVGGTGAGTKNKSALRNLKAKIAREARKA